MIRLLSSKRRSTINKKLLVSLSSSSSSKQGGGGGGRHQFLTTNATNTLNAEEQGMKTSTRILLFSAGVSSVGLGTLSYMLSSDEDFLFKTRDSYPGLVNFLAPWIGLPVIESTGVLDVESFGPRDVSEIVGDSVKVIVKLQSGNILLLDAKATDSQETILGMVKKQTNEPVIDLLFADSNETINDVKNELKVKIPSMPTQKTRESLEIALALCALQERDLLVQIELAERYGRDKTSIEQTMQELKARMNEIDAEMKKLPGQGLKGFLLRGR